MTDVTAPITFDAWLADNRHLLRPPVNNKQLMPTGDDFIVMVVGGPNQRDDFHVDPYEEWFYQIKGDIQVVLMTPDGRHPVDIREGQMWMLPRDTPHSPQRPDPDSLGMVIERVREEGTTEKFQWYCPSCDALVHEVELQVRDIVADLPPVFAAFNADAELRTCSRCGTVHPAR